MELLTKIIRNPNAVAERERGNVFKRNQKMLIDFFLDRRATYANNVDYYHLPTNPARHSVLVRKCELRPTAYMFSHQGKQLLRGLINLVVEKHREGLNCSTFLSLDNLMVHKEDYSIVNFINFEDVGGNSQNLVSDGYGAVSIVIQSLLSWCGLGNEQYPHELEDFLTLLGTPTRFFVDVKNHPVMWDSNRRWAFIIKLHNNLNNFRFRDQFKTEMFIRSGSGFDWRVYVPPNPQNPLYDAWFREEERYDDPSSLDKQDSFTSDIDDNYKLRVYNLVRIIRNCLSHSGSYNVEEIFEFVYESFPFLFVWIREVLLTMNKYRLFYEE